VRSKRRVACSSCTCVHFFCIGLFRGHCCTCRVFLCLLWREHQHDTRVACMHVPIEMCSCPIDRAYVSHSCAMCFSPLLFFNPSNPLPSARAPSVTSALVLRQVPSIKVCDPLSLSVLTLSRMCPSLNCDGTAVAVVVVLVDERSNAVERDAERNTRIVPEVEYCWWSTLRG
jgi:hypothetical protein